MLQLAGSIHFLVTKILSKFQFFFLFICALLLASCSITEKKQGDPILILETKILETNEFAAWRLSKSEQHITSSNRAVSQLLQQSDDLIAKAKYEQAGDKLERLVRIEPKFAQAWSRLAWMALKNNDAQRSHQLAQRSNSYSRNNTNLKLLNWQFIQKAGELLNSIDIIHQAEQMIKTLSDE